MIGNSDNEVICRTGKESWAANTPNDSPLSGHFSTCAANRVFFVVRRILEIEASVETWRPK
jgi:hypothetical protein